MSTTISPNMGLVVPGVGNEVGPNWALEINSDLSILDQHNHSAGQGVPIQPNGININADLQFNSNNATMLRSVRFTPQSVTLSLASDIGCVYVVGNELYYNDVTGGNQIKITNNGSVNSGAGSIGGLPSGTASATFSAGTFVWQSATSTAANMDFGSAVFRNSTANSKGLTLQPPAAMASNYSLTLPALPPSQSFLTIDTSGNISGYASINQGIARSNIVPVGQQISASSGVFNTTSSQLVPNLTVTITTSGRPIMVFCQSDGSAGFGGGSFNNIATSGVANWFLQRVGAANNLAFIGAGASGAVPASGILYLDVQSAGTYTYQIFTTVGGAGVSETFNVVLVAYEL